MRLSHKTMLNKTDFGKVYKILDNCLTDFSEADRISKHGSNKQKRKKAQSEADSALKLAKYHAENNDEIYKLILSTCHSQFDYEEFWSEKYFERDMRRFLPILKEKIETLDKE